MARKPKSPKRRSITDNYQPKKRSGWAKWTIVGLLGLALIGFILMSIPRQPASGGPTFTKEGELTISDGTTGNALVNIDIEIADNREDIVQGLMYRPQMQADRGMLFLMEAEEPQSFWMLNTLISLDIIYIDSDKEIVSIAPDTTPKSTDPIPSGAPAKYVLEVNAGFCQRHNVKLGDRVVW
ncbi:DUF192 domain-containing protein [Lewinella sp. W8]|uniref:DUF192 domain-containing protein n=1 Tax=Lewinella sp. W8 TaxID=2528208 RepID=UPI001565B2AC|nr:DUF192 domain-containing protein [Lewinella sp. W8]